MDEVGEVDEKCMAPENSSADAVLVFPMSALADVELDASLQFGSRRMSLHEAMELRPGDVVELNRNVSDPVDLVVGDRIVAKGEVVVVDGCLALRVTAVATPGSSMESVQCLF